MRINAVEAIELAGEGQQGAYGRPYGLIVRVTTDAGITGYGETDSLPTAAKAVIDAPWHNEMMSGLGPVLVGIDPLDIDAAWRSMARATLGYARDGVTRQAMAAIDIALWDIKGKALGKPVCELLGPVRRRVLETYGTYPLGTTLGETSANARRLVNAGFRAVKFGWHPLGPDADQDEAIVRTLREAIGPDVKLMIDGGLAWDTRQALERCQRFGAFNLTWLEEPLEAYDMAGYRELAARSDIPIAAGEMASSRTELERLLREGGVQVLQVDISRVGLTEAMKIAEVTGDLGVPCINHTYSTDINLAASLHWMAAIEQVSLCEVQATPNEIREALTGNRLLPTNGQIRVPEGPGLGIELNEDALGRFRV